jgi:hemerythrin-like domain-containing protein
MTDNSADSRRRFLAISAAAGAGALLGGCTTAAKHDAAANQPEDAEKVTPGEDLMQEHGVLKRLLLIYGEGIRRIDANQDLPPEAIEKSAKLVRSFVEEYHEKQEEDWVFPRLQKANKEVDTVRILLEQHRAGRKVTDRIITLATAAALRDPDRRHEIAARMADFIRMYAVHEAREDTVVFPAFRDLVSKREYDSLGEQFERNEHAHFGADGFDLAVDQVTVIEKSLGIFELSQFTPRL